MATWTRERSGLALSIGLALALYWPAVLGTGFFFQRDVWRYWIPQIEWAARSLASGQLPQWNPFVAFGSPYLADPSFQFFYPPALLNWILPGRTAYTLLVVGHAVLGSVGVFRLLKPRLRSWPAAVVGAAVFVASGPLVSSANLWHHFSSVAYMPWVLDAFLRLRAGRGSVWGLGLWTGLQALAGSADACAMTGVGLILLLPSRWARLRLLAPRLAAALALCLMLAAVQWVPAALLAAQSSRASLSLATRLHWSVSPATLIDLVIPLDGAAHAVPTEPDFLEQRLRFIPWMYMGASTLPFLVLGVRAAPRAALMLLFSILLSMGRYTPLAEWAGHLPLVSTFRFPAKLLWFVAGCWATLTATGFSVWTRRRESVDRWGLLAGIALVGVAAIGFAARPGPDTDHPDWRRISEALPWASAALGSALLAVSIGRRGCLAAMAVIVVDLVGSGQTYNAYASTELFTTRPAIVDQLRRLEARRIFVAQRSRSEVQSWKVPTGWSQEEAYLFGEGQLLLPPQASRWSIHGSFDGDFTGLARPEYSALFMELAGSDPTSPRLLQIAGVSHVTRFKGRTPPEFDVVAELPTLFDRPVLVLRVPEPLPPAYVVHRIQVESSMEAAVQTLTNAAFDPTRSIVRVSRDEPAGLFEDGSTDRSSARLVQEEGSRVRIRADLKRPGTLVVLNAFAPGWKARVDRLPRPVLPANLLFQSIDLDAGEHLVELEYQTPGLVPGFVLSALAWAAAIVVLSGVQSRRRTA